MRDVTRYHLKILNSEGWLPIILMDLRLAGSTEASTFRLTNAGEVVEWNGNEYSPVNMARGLLNELVVTDSGNQLGLTMQISNIDLQMAELLSQAVLEDAEVSVRVCDRRLLARARDRLELTTGRLRSPQLTASTLTFQVVNIIGQLDEITIPRRLWKPECNYTYGSPACGVDITASPNQISTTALTGTTEHYVVASSSVITTAGNPSDPNEYWVDGYIIPVDGPNATLTQAFQRYQVVGSEHRFYVKSPWRVPCAIGNTVLIRRGCPKTKVACQERQGNLNQYGGFEEVPYGNIQPVLIEVGRNDKFI